MARSCKVAVDSVNVNKNWYLDVVPFDQNRAVLNPFKDYRPSARGYTNCSFLQTSSSENISRFIATTQGPLPHKYEDFWEMIIQHHFPVIMMLTRLVDNYEAEESPMCVLHIQYLERPDHGVSTNTNGVREILRRAYHTPPSLGPGNLLDLHNI
ncbi:protein-tyrosine-phosphatase PTP1 [Populus alba x Populus x berolinensis]|nr:protein-tyrosine-phosphatase PTP1 [Populus alba x Populus x berolinensis]